MRRKGKAQLRNDANSKTQDKQALDQIKNEDAKTNLNYIFIALTITVV